MTDVLGIHSWDDTRGRTWFRARGFGLAYQRLYEWLGTVTIAEQWDDMPWHGFTLADPRDAETLKTRFAEHYLGHEDEVEEADEPKVEPLDPRMAGLVDEFAEILFAELQKERDAEILAAIREASR